MTARAEDTDQARRLPAFVRREFEAYLPCGRLDHGLRLRRGVCNSCGGRRMSELAAQLVDRVIPDVPVRQWVLSRDPRAGARPDRAGARPA